jgi:hypothetical protein
MLIVEGARITAVEHKIANGGVSSRIKVTGKFTAKVATALNARWLLFDKQQLVKDGFDSVELKAEMLNIRMRFEIPKLGRPIELTSERADRFRVMRRESKKKSAALVLQFRVHHAGSPFELLEHMISVGGAEGTITVESLQRDLFERKEEAAKETAAQKVSKRVAKGERLKGKIHRSQERQLEIARAIKAASEGNFDERMMGAADADEGRKIIGAFEDAVRTFQHDLRTDKMNCGFSTLTKAQKRIMVGQARAIDQDAGKAMRRLIQQGERMMFHFEDLYNAELAGHSVTPAAIDGAVSDEAQVQ